MNAIALFYSRQSPFPFTLDVDTTDDSLALWLLSEVSVIYF